MTLRLPTEVDYPESDGQPMGETDWHIDALIRLRGILRRRYRDQRVYVGSDMLVYYVLGDPRRFLSPDVFVVFDCDPRDRATFKIWEEKRVPDVVFEITSRSTARDDQVSKPKIYQQIGVKEVFLFDPTAEYLSPQLQGIRFVAGTQVVARPESMKLQSEVLGVCLSVLNGQLQLTDSITGETLLTGEESESRAKEIAYREVEYQRKEKERERNEKERERNEKEREQREKEQERQARIASEDRVRLLQRELDELRNQRKVE